MTVIQIFALIGVALISAIFGGYAMFLFFKFALRHSTVVGMEVGTCGNPECRRMHLRINTLNATASLGVSQTILDVDPKLAGILITAFNAAEPACPPPLHAVDSRPDQEIADEQRKIWRHMAGEMRDFLLEVAHEELTAERAKRAGDMASGQR